MKNCLIIVFAGAAMGALAQGRVGVNTNSPLAGFHVKSTEVLFSGDTVSNPVNLANTGNGVRMAWYPSKGAFRVGRGPIFDQLDSVGYFSIAMGRFTNAQANGSISLGGVNNVYGESAVAIGTGNWAEGTSSVAMGENNFAPGTNTMALGFGSAAIGNFSTAIGEKAVASGTRSIAMGSTATATGANATAIGQLTLASGTSAAAFGFSTDATASYAVAMGLNSKASGYASTAMGNLTTASGDNSGALGYFVTSAAYSSFSIGRYNDAVAASTLNNWIDSDPLFIIGNGSSITKRNAFIVAKNCETGINVANGMPQAMLHIKAREGGNDRHIRLEAYNSTNNGNIFYNNDFLFRNNTSGGDFYFVNSAGANVLAMFSTGNMTIAGVLVQNSDERLKKNITPLDNSLEKIMQVGGYHYQWNEEYRDQSMQTGLLAQQIETTMPELVSTSEAGIKSVNYNGMIPYLVEAMKELKAALEIQENINKKLQEEVQQLKRKR